MVNRRPGGVQHAWKYVFLGSNLFPIYLKS
jgi:hypothetical protein